MGRGHPQGVPGGGALVSAGDGRLTPRPTPAAGAGIARGAQGRPAGWAPLPDTVTARSWTPGKLHPVPASFPGSGPRQAEAGGQLGVHLLLAHVHSRAAGPSVPPGHPRDCIRTQQQSLRRCPEQVTRAGARTWLPGGEGGRAAGSHSKSRGAGAHS